MKFRLTLLFTALSLICAVFLLPSFLHWPMVLTILFVSGGFISFGVVNIQSGFFYPATSRIEQKEVLVTFDDGPDPEKTPRILQILEEKNVRAIFFLIGQKAEEHPELVRKILAGGHLIGNHTYSHNVFFSLKNSSFVAAEIDRAEQVLQRAGSREIYLFRPPVGYLNPVIAGELRRRHTRVIGWRLRSFDTVLKEERLLERLLKKTREGDIVLFHDTQDATEKILETYIDRMRERSINFVASTENLFKA